MRPADPLRDTYAWPSGKRIDGDGRRMQTSELEPRAILQALGIVGPVSAVPCSGGSDTAIWRVEHGGACYALRVFRVEQAETCRREVAALAAAVDGGIPAPLIHAEGVWRDRPALLLSWLPGRPIGDVLAARPWLAPRLGVLFGRMQAAIHRLPAPDALRAPDRGWITWGGAAGEPLRRRLQALAGDSDALLHLDYHPLNVLTDGARITAVLDWANAHAGDPRADAARTYTILRLDAADPLRSTLAARGMLRLFEWGWRHGYERAMPDQGDRAPFYAWAGAVMGRDLAAKRGPDSLARMIKWTEEWTRRASGRSSMPAWAGSPGSAGETPALPGLSRVGVNRRASGSDAPYMRLTL